MHCLICLKIYYPGGKFYAQDFVTIEEGLNVRERTLLLKKFFAMGYYQESNIEIRCTMLAFATLILKM